MKKTGDFLWALVFLGITSLLIIPETNHIYESLNGSHPFFMGFMKFAILASMGELLALRIIGGQWKRTKGFFSKALVWGIIGILVVFMFRFYNTAVVTLVSKKMLWAGSGIAAVILPAFYTSSIMNLTFGPVFMALHRISDTWIDKRAEGEILGIGQVLQVIEWPGFLSFVVAKTIPFFWIPVHTIAFILPGNYRVLMAAYLSIVLGIILAVARRRK